jgi:hypothetical protein
VVGSGGRAVSDPVPSMAAVFGDAVRQVSGPAETKAAIEDLLARPRDGKDSSTNYGRMSSTNRPRKNHLAAQSDTSSPITCTIAPKSYTSCIVLE